MKKICKWLVGVFINCLLIATPIYASESLEWEISAQEEGLNEMSALLPKEASISTDLDSVTRGRYIASSGLSISNEGYGVLGVYVDTLAHVPVKKIKMTVYLDQWDEEAEDWMQIDSKELVYEDEDESEDLHMATESFLVENLETDKYYRLRGLHAVWSFDGYVESHATMTNGILLTDGPA